MRLIDADNIKYTKLLSQQGLDMELVAKVAIDNMPTVDAEAVRHGRWLPKKVGVVTTEFECSECGGIVTFANDYYGKATKYVSSYYPYCHCGAKMDKEGEK